MLGIVGFVEGRYMSGRGGSGGSGTAWREYGPGAYAGESPMHLVTAGAGLTVLVWCVLAGWARIRRTPIPATGAMWLSLGILGVSSATGFVLLVANRAGGVPFHNLRPTDADDLLYALWCILPLSVLAAATAGVVALVRQRRTRDAPV